MSKKIICSLLAAMAMAFGACSSAPASSTTSTNVSETSQDEKTTTDDTKEVKETESKTDDSSSRKDPKKEDASGSQKEAADQTSTAPAVFSSQSSFNAEISQYPFLYKDGVQAFSDETDDGTYVIPGLIQTSTFEDGTKALCDEMVPQGIAVADDYVIISAYCKEHVHNSVLYLMDKDSHAFIKTVPMEGKNHEGGIAWHEDTGMVWVATHDKAASASSVSLADLKKYSYETADAPQKFSHTIETTSLSDDSFMTCHDDALYLGTFTSDGSSVIEKFDISDPGKIQSSPDATYSISDWCQGIVFYKDYILLSDSDGHSPSKLRVFKADDAKLLDGDEITSITLPERLEQVAVDDDHAYVLFESAANAYKAEDISKLDRVVQVDLEKVKFGK